jgi:hypothetical protein
MKFYTGKNDGSVVPVEHKTLKAAEAWFLSQEKVDPEGVKAGEYYLDAPEGSPMRKIIVAGNLSDGFTFIGPFGDWEEMQDYAEAHRIDEYWGASLTRPERGHWEPALGTDGEHWVETPVPVDEQLTDDDYAIIREEGES